MPVCESAVPFEARYSLPKLGRWMVVSGGCLGVSAYMVGIAHEAGSPSMLTVTLLGVAFFGFACLAFLRCAVDRRVQVKIYPAGLFVRAHSKKVIPLRSLSGVVDKGSRVIFGLTKPGKFPIQSRWRRFLFRINSTEAGAYFGNVWIWTTLLDCRPRDILNAVHDFRVPTAFELELRALGAAAKTDIVPVRL